MSHFVQDLESEVVKFIDPLKTQQELMSCHISTVRKDLQVKNLKSSRVQADKFMAFSSLLSSISVHTLQRGQNTYYFLYELWKTT